MLKITRILLLYYRQFIIFNKITKSMEEAKKTTGGVYHFGIQMVWGAIIYIYSRA
jgi:hypothetical protein